jgi:hypothetical protein
LQLLSEWGFPATLLVLAVLGYTAVRLIVFLRQTAHGSPSNGCGLKLSLAAALIAGAAHACVSGLLVMPASQVMAPLAGGWLLALTTRGRGASRSQIFAGLLLCAALLAAVSVTVFALREAPQRSARQAGFSDHERSMPRFWQEGRACRYIYRK